MLRRLLTVLLPLAVLVVTALGVPLGIAIAQRETQETYVDRLNDVGRFASLADTALSRGRIEALEAELVRYHELFDIPVALLDAGGTIVIAGGLDSGGLDSGGLDSGGLDSGGLDSGGLGESRGRGGSGGRPPDVLRSQAVTQALAGHRPEPPGPRWPWSDEPMVVAEPVGRDSELVGVVVSVSPTDRLRSGILTNWARLALLGMLPTTGLLVVIWPVSRWILRPVRRLDDAAARIADGDLSVRADAGRGPPELRRLAGSFNAMVDVVERALNRQRAFVADASHQLRNPLASLRLAVENLGPHLTGDQAEEAHTVAIEEAKAMHRLLNSLLAVTRLESVKQAEPVDLDTVLRTRAERWRALAGQAGIRLELAVPPGLVAYEPPGGLGGVLDELVSNALRLSGGSRVELRAAASADGPGHIELRVGDDGAGLAPKDREAALGRFWRAPEHQNTPGTGLGLAICAELLEAAGGHLRLEPGLLRAAGAAMEPDDDDTDSTDGTDGTGHGLAAVIRLPVPTADSSHPRGSRP